MNTWIKRSAGLIATAAAALAVMGPTAEAGQSAAVPFTVTTTVFTACSITIPTPTLTFANYTSGQTGTSTGNMDIEIACPGAGPSPNNMNVQLSFAPVIVSPAVGYEMSQGGSGAAPYLTYELCDNTAGCVVGAGLYTNGTLTGSPLVPIATSGNVSYSLLGVIPGGQLPAASATAYKQSVNGYVNF